MTFIGSVEVSQIEISDELNAIVFGKMGNNLDDMKFHR